MPPPHTPWASYASPYTNLQHPYVPSFLYGMPHPYHASYSKFAIVPPYYGYR